MYRALENGICFFAEQLHRQVDRFGAELLQAQEVVKVYSHDNYRCIDTADGSQYSACALLLATGSRYRRLGAPGEESYIGAGIHFSGDPSLQIEFAKDGANLIIHSSDIVMFVKHMRAEVDMIRGAVGEESAANKQWQPIQKDAPI